MKPLLIIIASMAMLCISKVQSQTLSQHSSTQTNTFKTLIPGEENATPLSILPLSCDPPFLLTGLFDPAIANDPYPVIMDEEVKLELMLDGLEGKDKEFGDIDNDGDIDILYTRDDNQLWLLRNSGDATHPEYLIEDAMATGFGGVFSFRLMDWFGDGIIDLAVLEKFVGDPATITLYIDINSQIGFPAPIGYLIDGILDPINASQFIEVSDIDGDGFPEILVSGQGPINGTACFKNFGMGWSFPPTYRLLLPQTYSSPMIPENGGSTPCPELFDADCDGDLDLFISDPLWVGGGGRVDYYENTGAGSPLLYFTQVSPNPYGLDDIVLPNTDLSCEVVVTRFADFFGDGFPEAIAHNPCDGGIFYYSHSFPCQASFEIFGNEFCNDYQFINTSSGAGQVTYLWNFDDPASGINNTSSFFEPSHIFSACGLYNVCLRISGDECESEFCLVVNVTDPVPPVALCLGISMILDNNCMATVLPGFIDGGSSDNCLLTSLSVSPNTFNHCGFYPVTLTATDWCGNTNTCVTNIQVSGFV
ncbi:MAG: FG-GAP-like repeat-containing protein, partial [Saprospiraceae bacterium]